MLDASPTSGVALTTPLGMVSLRGDLASPTLREAVLALTGTPVPAPLRIEGDSRGGAAWMAPDELLLFVPRDQAPLAVSNLSQALQGSHHLAFDVSDLRLCVAVDVPDAREVLAKLSPADLHPDSFGSGSFRRTRLGQLAAAIWLEGEGARVLCFRSLADYAVALLRQSAQDGPVRFF
jgi:sarcosine oxidase subunit gamma